MATRWELGLRGAHHPVEVGPGGVTVGEEAIAAKVVSTGGDEAVIEVEGRAYRVAFRDGALMLDGRPVEVSLRRLPPRLGRTGAGSAAGRLEVRPPMPGRVVSVAAKDGQAVEKGAVLVVLEAMKMQNEITAPASGVVRSVAVKAGEAIEASKVLCVIEPAQRVQETEP